MSKHLEVCGQLFSFFCFENSSKNFSKFQKFRVFQICVNFYLASELLSYWHFCDFKNPVKFKNVTITPATTWYFVIKVLKLFTVVLSISRVKILQYIIEVWGIIYLEPML
jgi:hypothetical protein